ncbi:MAG: hypothetical protein U5K69_28810 [Balneolaceae bacterium]|nr:hypothetical protein [Balneolaceae bacterium]
MLGQVFGAVSAAQENPQLIAHNIAIGESPRLDPLAQLPVDKIGQPRLMKMLITKIKSAKWCDLVR